MDDEVEAKGSFAEEFARRLGRSCNSATVTINMAVYERQLAERARDREFRRKLDPFGLGHWGPIDDDGPDR